MDESRVVCGVILDNRGKRTELFDYVFVGIPQNGDVIDQDGQLYTIIGREWKNGHLVIVVKEGLSQGIVKA